MREGNTIPCIWPVERGPRSGAPCGRRAIAIVVATGHAGTPVCGTHARAWLKPGLARIAYWHEKEQAWL